MYILNDVMYDVIVLTKRISSCDVYVLYILLYPCCCVISVSSKIDIS